MDIHRLSSFRAVVEEGGFGRAARRMFVSQPAISMQVQALERELGEQLLIRSSRGVEVTPAGAVLFEHVRRIFDEWDMARRQMSELRDLRRGRVSIGCSDTIAMHKLPEWLKGFLSRFPDIEFAMHSRHSRQIGRMLQAREIDLGMVTLPLSTPEVRTTTLFTYRDVAVFLPGDPLDGLPRLELADLVDRRLLLPAEGTHSRTHFDADLLGAGLFLGDMMQFGGVEIQKSFAQAGLGVAIVPDFAVATEVREGTLRSAEVAELQMRSIGLAYVANRRFSRASGAFARHILEREGRSVDFEPPD